MNLHRYGILVPEHDVDQAILDQDVQLFAPDGLAALRDSLAVGSVAAPAALRIQLRMLAQESDDEIAETAEELLETLRRKPGRDYRVASGGGRMRVSMDRSPTSTAFVIDQPASFRTFRARIHFMRRWSTIFMQRKYYSIAPNQVISAPNSIAPKVATLT